MNEWRTPYLPVQILSQHEYLQQLVRLDLGQVIICFTSCLVCDQGGTVCTYQVAMV